MFWLLTLALLLGGDTPRCVCPSSVTVSVQELSGSRVVYSYAVKNLGDYPVVGILIGTAAEHDAQLERLPNGCTELADDECACSIDAPSGWSGCVGLQEESNLHFLEFRPQGDTPGIAPNATAVFDVTLPEAARAHERPIVWVINDRGCGFVGNATLVAPN